jgi:hypothetical protein
MPIEGLGRKFSVKKVAKLMSLGINNVYTRYKELGGIKIGRKIIFFEANLVAAIKNIQEIQSAQQEEEQEGSMAVVRKNCLEGRGGDNETLSNKRRSKLMGSKEERGIIKSKKLDRHNLIA